MGTGVKALRLLQFGQEAVKGTPVVATARFLGDVTMQDASEVVVPERDFGVITAHFDPGEVLAQLAAIECPETELSFEQCHYPFISSFGSPTATEETVGQGDYVRIFAVPTATAPLPKTLTAEWVEKDGTGTVVQKLQSSYVFCRSFTIRAEKGANYALMSASWVGRGPAVLGSVASLALPTRTLIPAGKVSVHVATTYAGLGTAKTSVGEPAALANVNAVELEVTTGLDIKRLLDGSLDYKREKLIPRVTGLRITYDLDALTETERQDFFRTAARRFIRVKAVGAQIGTGLTRKIVVDAPYRLMSYPTPGDDEGESTVELEYTSLYDPTAAKELEITTVSTLVTIP